MVLQKLEKISAFVSTNMAILVVAVATLALFVPETFAWATSKITLLLGVVMFGMGMTLRLSDFAQIIRRPRDVLIGLVAQFTIMPLVAYALAIMFALPADLAAGVIIVGTCPGGTSSNVMTYLAKGDLALSVSMTMTSTILAPLVTPILAMMFSIAQIVILPIVAGIIINHLFAPFVARITKILPIVSIIAILLIVGGVVSVNAEKIFATGLLIMLVVILHNLSGYALGYVAAKIFGMDLAAAKAVSIEVGMQNSGLATSLAMLHFSAAAAIPGAIFSVWHNISGSIAANYLAHQSNKLS